MWPAEKSGCCGVSVLVIRSTQFFLLHSRTSDKALSVIEVYSGFQTLAKLETKTPQSNKHPQTQNTTQNKKPASVWNVKREVRIFFFLVSRTRHHSCAGHCFTIRSHCNFFRNATIPPGRIKQQKKTKQTATKQNQQRNTNQTQTENQTPEWKQSSLFLYNVQLK